MPTKVLIFENDTQFAADLAAALRSVGAEATIVEDPNQGLQIAATERPQLIVLAVELHKMNGFSVCNRIKKEPALSSVPVILTTSNSTDATIEQHKQRPNHADEYVRKPVTVDALLERIGRFVNLGQSVRPSAPPADDDIIIDDDILEVDEEASPSPSMRPSVSVLPDDSDVSTFADAAFRGMMTEPERPSRPAPESRPSQIPVANASSPVSLPPASSEAAKVRIDRLEHALDEANIKIEELKSQDTSAKDAELESLRRELDDAHAKAMVAGRGAGTTSAAREVLDLREQLHKKEKELLDLRDKVTQREKEIFGLKDSALTFERDKADLSDKLDDIARQLTETQRHVEAARTDKEAANKRNEDAKRRIDKLTQQLEEKAQELDTQRGLYENAQRANAEEQARLRDEQLAAEQHAAEELRSAMARASEEINLQAEKAQKHLEESLDQKEDERRQALEQVRGQAAEEKATALQELHDTLTATHESVVEQLNNEHANELQSLRDQQAKELQSLRNQQAEELQSLRDQHAGTTQRLREEFAHNEQTTRDAQAAVLEQLTQSHEAALQNARNQHDAALRQSQTEREISEQKRDERIATLEQELDENRQRLADAQNRITDFTRGAERAQAKFVSDKGDIDKIKDALSSVVLHLDAIEGRTLE